MSRKPPILTTSPLTGRVYIVTAYQEMWRDGQFRGVKATSKFDVTEQFDVIAAERAAGVASDE